MKKIIITALLCSGSAYAIDFDGYLKKIKSKVNTIMGKEETSQKVEAFPMPKIPEVKSSATSTEVYNKSGKLFQQGDAFNKLSKKDKRRYHLAFLQELYLVVRGGEGTKSEILNSLNVLEQGGSREGVYRSLVLSTSYNVLESYEEVASDALVDFTYNYSVEFLALKFNKDQLKKLNLWGLKRVIVEKTLEIMDSFDPDSDDLHRWYAYISRSFSDNHGGVLKNKTRLSNSLKFHKLWAEKVPFQQIKSEMIIKLHTVMNSLQ